MPYPPSDARVLRTAAALQSVPDLYRDFDQLHGRRVRVWGPCRSIGQRVDGSVCFVLMDGRLAVEGHGVAAAAAPFADAEGIMVAVEGRVTDYARGRGIILQRCRRLVLAPIE